MSDKDEEKKKLGWKDYLAIAIAMLTTTLLPLLIIILILLVVVVFFAL